MKQAQEHESKQGYQNEQGHAQDVNEIETHLHYLWFLNKNIKESTSCLVFLLAFVFIHSH